MMAGVGPTEDMFLVFITDLYGNFCTQIAFHKSLQTSAIAGS
jgi:hypothetical protein